VTRILRIRGTGSRRVHLHLRIALDHVRSVRGLVCHHLAAHCWPWGTDELTALCVSHSAMLHIRAHAVLRNLMRVAWHWLWLCTIHEWWNGSG
jgi:hypothetical protein